VKPKNIKTSKPENKANPKTKQVKLENIKQANSPLFTAILHIISSVSSIIGILSLITFVSG